MDSFSHTLPGKVWGSWRFVMYKLVEHKYFETFIIMMILASSMALVRTDTLLSIFLSICRTVFSYLVKTDLFILIQFLRLSPPIRWVLRRYVFGLSARLCVRASRDHLHRESEKEAFSDRLAVDF